MPQASATPVHAGELLRGAARGSGPRALWQVIQSARRRDRARRWRQRVAPTGARAARPLRGGLGDADAP